MYFNLILKDQYFNKGNCYCFSTFFFTKLNEKLIYNYNNVKSYVKNVNIFDFNQVLIPVNLFNNHWVLCIIDFICQEINYFDSYISQPIDGIAIDVLNKIKKFVIDEAKNQQNKSNFENFNMLIQNPPQQTNGSDCGVYVCQFGKLFAKKKLICETEFKTEKIVKFRSNMLLEIFNGNLMF